MKTHYLPRTIRIITRNMCKYIPNADYNYGTNIHDSKERLYVSYFNPCSFINVKILYFCICFS